MRIRKTKREDLSRIVEIFRIENIKKPYLLKRSRKEALEKIKGIMKGTDVYSLDVDGKVIGFFVCELRPQKQIYFSELWIDKKYQNKGHGKKVMEFAEEKYRKKGYEEMIVVTDKNADASKFYKKIGYTVRNEWLFMGKKLR